MKKIITRIMIYSSYTLMFVTGILNLTDENNIVGTIVCALLFFLVLVLIVEITNDGE